MNKTAHALRTSHNDRHRFKRPLSVIFTLMMLANVQTAIGQSHKPVAILAGQYVAPDGSLQPGAAIVLSSGKIKSIRPIKQFSSCFTRGLVCRLI